MNGYGNCYCCKYAMRSPLVPPCDTCDDNNNFEPVAVEPIEEATQTVQISNENLIRSIIDEAMEKRDRTVSVFINGDATSVTVTPLGEDEPRWIVRSLGYECSVCGCIFPVMSRYCSNCGEALKVPPLGDYLPIEKTKGVDFSKSCGKCKHRFGQVRAMMKHIETGEEIGENICEHCYNYDEFEEEASDASQ